MLRTHPTLDPICHVRATQQKQFGHPDAPFQQVAPEQESRPQKVTLQTWALSTTEMCSGFEAGSYLRLIEFVYRSTLGLSVIKKNMLGNTRCGRGPQPARGPHAHGFFTARAHPQVMSLVPSREADAHVPDAGECAEVVRPDLYCACVRRDGVRRSGRDTTQSLVGGGCV